MHAYIMSRHLFLELDYMLIGLPDAKSTFFREFCILEIIYWPGLEARILSLLIVCLPRAFSSIPQP